MVTYADICDRALTDALTVFGAFHPSPGDHAPEGCGTLILLGPNEPGFWPHFTASPEYLDGCCNRLDRWSTRVISKMADEFGATPLFPFGGPPFQPFIRWANRSGRAWPSPVSLLVHDVAGLFASYRGALALPERIALPPLPARPCDTCIEQPCRDACPAGAMSGPGYALDTCHTFLDTPDGNDCMTQGCNVRRACPISQSYDRKPEQSAFHMAAFHP
ncbi:ferredoxin [Actibacterium lipolyticum]|uniref:Ferredoxin n=1 Tax=Actibacterium lipolyticum TaxID=1524263 RepID=A0A238JLE3_9RHOB|nr:ferredoxin [Actibacterium lipolyticum]SMX30997.1 hypothetical protein COL8621_00225 [Actibacterium lipolyticum]